MPSVSVGNNSYNVSLGQQSSVTVVSGDQSNDVTLGYSPVCSGMGSSRSNSQFVFRA